jgi:hypothetical protein
LIFFGGGGFNEKEEDTLEVAGGPPTNALKEGSFLLPRGLSIEGLVGALTGALRLPPPVLLLLL